MSSLHPADLGPEFERDLEFSAAQAQAENIHELSPELIRAAFELEGHKVCSCVDEGAKDGSLRLAGAGILHPGGPEAVAKILHDQEITEISSHDHCGAAMVAYRGEHGLPADAIVPQAEVDAWAEAWAKNVAQLAGITATHQHAEELNRPVDRHDAITVYVDGTGKTFRQQAIDAPKGFVVSTKGLAPDEVVKTVVFVDGIARGDHGFGDRFSNRHPLRYVFLDDVGHNVREQLAKRVANDPALSITELKVSVEPNEALAEVES